MDFATFVGLGVILSIFVPLQIPFEITFILFYGFQIIFSTFFHYHRSVQKHYYKSSICLLVCLIGVKITIFCGSYSEASLEQKVKYLKI